MLTTAAYAAFDESGDTGTSPKSSRFFVVTGIVCQNFDILNSIVLRTRKDLPHKKRADLPELKAFLAEPRITKKLLHRLVKEDIQIFAAIADKQTFSFKDPNDLYKTAYSAAIQAVASKYHHVFAVIDMFYTRPHQQSHFTKAIVNEITGPSQVLAITFDKSHNNRALQVADFVAWALFQHYGRGIPEFREILQPKIAEEIILK
jgi:hypothetical protein